ncbi:AAA family ATPase [Caldinitratiruptor microaerophilus]|uniref:ATPase n=1 Tax=Caldinitratiruptor microaerophilus TaxID=671077 RepID=A0AA35CKX6_9FIRM|nr:MoxR family ATPase [Caldinitratiruptor microaerophilus]BDG61199.1 ATPase [Caldinitratiruptor microaerophilus]
MSEEEERTIRTPEEIEALLAGQRYVAGRPVALAVSLALNLERPLLIEGQAGVGKTELAKVLAAALGTELIRLQCYEGLDASAALYEWNFPKQVLRLRIEENSGRTAEEKEALIFSEPFLLERPLLRAIRQPRPPVLLIDEVDRADEEFEALLLELLSDFQVTIPELGTIRATTRPYVILTSNRTRDLSDALRRRCLYLWLEYPDLEKELAIVRARAPEVDPDLAEAVTRVVQQVRRMDLEKPPGVAETLDWVRSLQTLGVSRLTPEWIRDTAGVLVKTRADAARLAAADLGRLLAPGGG